MEQKSLFGDDDGAPEEKVETSPIITSAVEVRELAQEYFQLPVPPGAEPPLLKLKREQAARVSGAHRRGLVAKWAPYDIAKGYIAIYDPGDGEWHDVDVFSAPGWAKREARRRAALYRAGDRHAYDLTSTHIQEIWDEEHPGEDEVIVEDHPLEEGE